MNITKSSLTKVSRSQNWEKTISSTNGGGKTVYSCTKEGS